MFTNLQDPLSWEGLTIEKVHVSKREDLITEILIRFEPKPNGEVFVGSVEADSYSHGYSHSINHVDTYVSNSNDAALYVLDFIDEDEYNRRKDEKQRKHNEYCKINRQKLDDEIKDAELKAYERISKKYNLGNFPP